MNSDIVLFAIRGALKLGQQARAAYVDSTRGRALVLPLPDFEPEGSFVGAVNFFRELTVEAPPQLVALVAKMLRNEVFTHTEEQLLIDYQNDILLRAFPGTHRTADGSPLSEVSLDALVEIRQWQRGSDPNPTTLQRIAGSLIEIGVDYFIEIPGALDSHASSGRALKAFLTGLDDVSFSEAALADLPHRLFVAVMESVASTPELIAADPKIQALIRITTRGLTEDVAARIEALRAAGEDNLSKEERIRAWGETVFRSLLTKAGAHVLSDPEGYLDLEGAGQRAVVANVGSALVGIVADTPFGGLDNLFTRASLDRLTDAALLAVGEHPELVLGDKSRLGALVGQLATDLAATESTFVRGIMPELARIVVDATGEHLELLWPEAQSDPGKNLALVAAKTIVETLSTPAADGDSWKPRFRTTDLVKVVDATMEELVMNPGWLIAALDDDRPALKAALESLVQVMRRRGNGYLSQDLAIDLLLAGLHAATLRSEFLEEIPNRGPLIGALLDALLAEIFSIDDPTLAWRLVKHEVLEGMLVVIVEVLNDTKLDARVLEPVTAVIRQQVEIVQSGEGWSIDDFGQALIDELQGGF